MKVFENLNSYLEVFDDYIEKQLDKKGVAFTKKKTKSPIIRGIPFWRIGKNTDIDYELWFNKKIKTKNDNIKNLNIFYIAFFGSNNFQQYEYGAISTDDIEIFKLLRSWDMQQAVIGVYDIKKMQVEYSEVNPFMVNKKGDYYGEINFNEGY